MVMVTRAHRRAWASMVSAYIFVSASQLALHATLALPADRTFVRHNFVPHRNPMAASSEAAVMYAGRLDEAKGLRILMAAWDRYCQESNASGLRLIIAGAGVLEQEVEIWASRRPSVDVVGHLTDGRCAEHMSHVRAVISPSIVEETFGLVALEAMALGIPVIATSHGSFPELITPERNGVLVPPGDPIALSLAIAEVAEFPVRYLKYGQQARETFEERFDPDLNLTQLENIYRFAIANPVLDSRKARSRSRKMSNEEPRAKQVARPS